jgi:uncharacterized membrane protein YccC
MRLLGYVRHPGAAALARWGRVPGLRTAKTTLAAVLAYVAADLLDTSPAPVLAALTALLVVQMTVYETVAQGLQRIFSVLAGVLLAVGIATFVGLTWWSLGAVVAVSVVVGIFLRLGPHLLEVPISAMLVLAVGAAGAEGAAFGRVYETLIGAAIGVVVNFAIAPPVNVRPAGDAIAQVTGQLAQFLRGFAGELRTGWSRAAAQRWLDQVRALAPDVDRADRSVARAEQSALLNPRGGEVREAQPRLRTAMTGIELCHILLRTLCREVFDRTFYLPQDKEIEAYSPEARAALADVLECAAEAMSGVGDVVTGAGPVDVARARVHDSLAALQESRNQLGRLLLVDPNVDAAAWQQHGALLAAIDRMRVEIEAAVRPASEPWHPPLLTERPRQAVRRMIDVAAEAAASAAAVAGASAHAAADDLRILRRRAPAADAAGDAAVDAAVDAHEVAAEAAEAAAAAQSAAEVAAAAADEAAVAADEVAADEAAADEAARTSQTARRPKRADP